MPECHQRGDFSLPETTFTFLRSLWMRKFFKMLLNRILVVCDKAENRSLLPCLLLVIFCFYPRSFYLTIQRKINLLIYFLIFLSTVAETQDDIDPTGTVNLQFLIPGTSEPISAMVGIVSVFLFLSLVYHVEKFFVKINTALFFISCLLQFSLRDNVQDLRQVVLDRPESCHRTCFSLQIDGVRLDDFAELHMIEGLKDGAVVKVVEGTFRDPNFCKTLMCIQLPSPHQIKSPYPW